MSKIGAAYLIGLGKSTKKIKRSNRLLPAPLLAAAAASARVDDYSPTIIPSWSHFSS
ncbi:unnamed protein product [Prunus armeniaca]|uniref:Uncharacterized protein n=1 Tax=Prunus armeniaca TaxID=36596 RepID=A0A6J5XCE8_PRUAR|nr:unnamed protein product [Prunus armeniaca]